MPKLYYFQAPAFTINPESDTAPKLGSIFSSLDRLTAPLNQLDYVYVPSSLKNESASANSNDTSERSAMGSMGLNAKIAQGIAGSAEVVYAFAREKKNMYYCELLETKEFEPTKDFIADCITASQRVQAFLENSLPGRKRVYMITGLKIATGFRMSTSKETSHGPMLKVGVDATAVGVPAGPQFELRTANKRTLSQGRSVNKIVFAYRVVRIRKKRDGQAKYKYKSGGKYSVDDDDSDEEDEEGSWDIEALDEEDRLEDFPDSVRLEIEDRTGSEGAVR